MIMAMTATAREFAVSGPQGGLSMKVSLPEGFDPGDPPEYIKCFHHFKLGRNYMLQTQELDIYGVSAGFQGPVCIIHGSKDGTVPLWCSEKYMDIYSNAEMHIVEGENHLIIRKQKEVIGIILDFMKQTLN